MKNVRVVVIVLAFTSLLVAAGTVFLFDGNELTPNIPNVFTSSQTRFQQQTHFLTFTGSSTPGENVKTATAYYNAIDPYHTSKTFPEWLVKTGFIDTVDHWHPTGPQKIACDLGPENGCDMAAHNPDGSLVYGDNIINTDSHAIVLNAADLGFVRNQFVRCVPSCSATNPIIYTYLENYPVNPFSASGNPGGSGFPAFTGFPSTSEAAAAIASALNRPSDFDPSNTAFTSCVAANTDTPFKCKTSRIADVAFEWAPPASNPTSSTRFGQLYAYIFDQKDAATNACQKDGAGRCLPTETIAFPNSFSQNCNDPVATTPLTNCSPNVATHQLETFNGGLNVDPIPSNNNSYTGVTGDPFPPNLDFIGFKQHPGVCFICHGGKPRNLTASGTYPNQGNVSGFRYLPIDVRNMLFSSDSNGEQPALNGSVAYTDRSHQELQIKKYNQAVLLTVPKGKASDGTGATRVAHLREVIIGWYAGFPGDQTMSSNVQNGFWETNLQRDFIPQAWLEPLHGGTAPKGSEQIYTEVVATDCRSCHFNREISLDFGTPANFKQESDILQLALLPQCKNRNPDPNAKFMPLAHLTYQKYWQANTSTGGGTQTYPYPAVPTPPNPLSVSSTADQIAQYFGFSNVAAYCATNP